MSYPLKLLKTVWFGIKNNKVLLGFMLLMCAVICPAFSVIFVRESSSTGVFECISAYFCGIVVPIAMFGYLHQGRECEFYNAMPVKKSQYFWGYVIAGFLIFLISLTLLSGVQSAFGYHDRSNFYLKSIGAFLSIYCSTILAVVFSGSTASTVVTLIIRNGLAIALVALPLMIAAVDVNAYVELLFKPICILTPVTVGNAILDPQTTGVQGYQLIVAAAELIIAFFLHRYRRNETVTALAFPKSRYFYQYTVMLILALGADALFLPASGSYDSVYGINISGNNFPLVVFLTLLVIFISFMLMNMVLEKNAKAAFKRIRHFFLFSVGYGILIFSVSGICTYCIPPSVLPFRPDCAVIKVYSVEETSEEDSYDFTMYTVNENDEFRFRHYKRIQQDEFAVISPDKVKELVYLAMHPGSNRTGYDSFGMLPKNTISPYEPKSGVYTAYHNLPNETFTLFTVEFRRSGRAEGEQAVILYDDLTARYGYALSPELILAYKDFDIS